MFSMGPQELLLHMEKILLLMYQRVELVVDAFFSDVLVESVVNSVQAVAVQ